MHTPPLKGTNIKAQHMWHTNLLSHLCTATIYIYSNKNNKILLNAVTFIATVVQSSTVVQLKECFLPKTGDQKSTMIKGAGGVTKLKRVKAKAVSLPPFKHHHLNITAIYVRTAQCKNRETFPATNKEMANQE